MGRNHTRVTRAACDQIARSVSVIGGVATPRGRRATTVTGVQIVVHRRELPPWTVLEVAGELDVVGAPDLRQHVMAAVRSGGHHLVLDLTGVDFIDSFGIGVVVGALKRTRLLDGDLRLVVPEPRVRRVFEVCDLDRIFTLHNGIDEAVARLEEEIR